MKFTTSSTSSATKSIAAKISKPRINGVCKTAKITKSNLQLVPTAIKKLVSPRMGRFQELKLPGPRIKWIQKVDFFQRRVDRMDWEKSPRGYCMYHVPYMPYTPFGPVPQPPSWQQLQLTFSSYLQAIPLPPVAVVPAPAPRCAPLHQDERFLKSQAPPVYTPQPTPAPLTTAMKSKYRARY